MWATSQLVSDTMGDFIMVPSFVTMATSYYNTENIFSEQKVYIRVIV